MTKTIETWTTSAKCDFLISEPGRLFRCFTPASFNVRFKDGTFEHLCETHFYYYYVLKEMEEYEKGKKRGGEKE